MMARTHVAFGILVGLFFITPYSFTNKILFMTALIIGSILPDIDHPKSRLGRKIKPIAYLFSFLFGHRGLLHAIWIPASLLIVHYYFYSNILLFALAIGCISHLVSDSFTVQGINFIHPFQKLHVSGFVETGGFVEMIILVLILVGIVVKVV